jgi:hypothetical protein
MWWCYGSFGACLVYLIEGQGSVIVFKEFNKLKEFGFLFNLVEIFVDKWMTRKPHFLVLEMS